MEKKAKIIATLGPAIYSNTKLKQLVNLGVDAFRINFSHKTQGINRIVSRIRKIEKSSNKKLALIADLQGVKLRVGNIKGDSQRIKYNQKYIFDTRKELGDNSRINFPYPKILKKLKKGNKILIDDGKYKEAHSILDNSENYQHIELKGDLYVLEGDYVSAIKNYKDVLTFSITPNERKNLIAKINLIK